MGTRNEPPVQTWGLFERAAAALAPRSPEPDDTWIIPSQRTGLGGTAWVYRSPENTTLRRPVIFADGFNAGPSKRDDCWHHLNVSDFPLATELHNRGYDVIIVGYNERSASIIENARVATDAIRRANRERHGDQALMVGGFSMGGLVTRYALAKMEAEREDHETAVYFSFDSPHRGGWIPPSLQSLAHYLTIAPAMSAQINSPASRQLLWRHRETVDGPLRMDPMREEFLAELDRVGNWPGIPTKIGVANGSGRGRPNGIPAGDPAVECTKGLFAPTLLSTQSRDPNIVVARLRGPISEYDIASEGLPEVDGAPGGKQDLFGIAADNLTIPMFGMEAVAYHREMCFVPSISAVDIADIDHDTIGMDISQMPPDRSELNEFLCSSDNTAHSQVTAELGRWLLERVPPK